MGLDVYLVRGDHATTEDGECGEHVELPSARYPDHLFKVGYFRSSYNSGGLNRVLNDYGLPDLDDIFGAERRYAFAPDWPDVLARIDVALDAFDAATKRMNLRAEATSPLLMGKAREDVRSAKDALEVYRTTLAKSASSEALGNGFSDYAGVFVPKGLTVRAFVRGLDALLQPAIYFVYDTTLHPSYRQSLEIVRETAEWVLAQPNPKAFHLHWSG